MPSASSTRSSTGRLVGSGGHARSGCSAPSGRASSSVLHLRPVVHAGVIAPRAIGCGEDRGPHVDTCWFCTANYSFDRRSRAFRSGTSPIVPKRYDGRRPTAGLCATGAPQASCVYRRSRPSASRSYGRHSRPRCAWDEVPRTCERRKRREQMTRRSASRTTCPRGGSQRALREVTPAVFIRAPRTVRVRARSQRPRQSPGPSRRIPLRAAGSSVRRRRVHRPARRVTRPGWRPPGIR